MNLHEVSATLPNGFHDAEVSMISLDLVNRRATLDLEIWIGDLDSPADIGCEVYRAGRLELRGFAYFAIELPASESRFAEGGAISVDLCDADPGLIPPTRPGAFAARFFVFDWNAFIDVSADEAELIWTAEPHDRGRNIRRGSEGGPRNDRPA